MWAGLLFSYSQSSMAALLLVTLALGLLTGDRRVRMAVGALAVAAALAAGGVRGRGADRRRSRSTTSPATAPSAWRTPTRVIEHNPVAGVGIGGQPRASRELVGSDRPTPNFVSHTTPLTVAAELGADRAWRCTCGCWSAARA